MPAFAPTPRPPRPSKTLDLAISVAAITWFLAARELASRSASGISQRLDLLALGTVLKPVFLLFLLLVGFYALDLISHRRSSTRDLLGLPARPTARQEWGIGAAVGWSALLLSVVPILVFGTLHIQLWTEPRAFLYLAASLIGAAFATLALEVAFRGYAFRRLIEATGPVGATLTMSLLYGLLFAFSPGSTSLGVLVMALLGLLLSVCWLRTHALWLGWGLNFAFTATLGVLFGLPVAGSTDLASVFQSFATGRQTITGGDFGPESAVFTAFVLLLAIAAITRLTRDFAWNYTHKPIIPGGYPMDVAPPSAHAAMETQTATAPPALVQILPTTPQQRSVTDPPR